MTGMRTFPGRVQDGILVAVGRVFVFVMLVGVGAVVMVKEATSSCVTPNAGEAAVNAATIDNDDDIAVFIADRRSIVVINNVGNYAIFIMRCEHIIIVTGIGIGIGIGISVAISIAVERNATAMVVGRKDRRSRRCCCCGPGNNRRASADQVEDNDTTIVLPLEESKQRPHGIVDNGRG
eukprot:CAMPEP_0194357748 /NCGR_PEP_ID=MMETSP0174-20130528/5192_1 /TAXON_ID=216777 /ORGANISM="Proboscia alata, Strain PI-D3" /LENGTH=178 /DNA_ID=CAMNT_0039127901 /DNA_START=984 /DNA_END=1516 /DNA_ORIENTATION=-